jgi:hypothetical protein
VATGIGKYCIYVFKIIFLLTFRVSVLTGHTKHSAPL